MLTRNGVNPSQASEQNNGSGVSLVQFLLWADDPTEVAALEAATGIGQFEAANDWIENTCWAQDCSDLVGGRGSPSDRLGHLRRAMIADGSGPFYRDGAS